MSLKISLIVRPPGDEGVVGELREAVKLLRAAGHQVSSRMTFGTFDAVRFARVAARRRCDLVLAAGGDGTINEVVNGMARCGWQPRLGIVPIGTANDFAHTLRLPERIEDAVEVALSGRPAAVDVGEVNGRCFINVSTGGFGADATASASLEAKRKLGKLAYLLTGARKLVELKPNRARFTGDDGEIYKGEFFFYAVGNARSTGGGQRVTPRADIGDGKLDVVIVPALPRLDFLALLPDLRAGTHLESSDVLYVQTRVLDVQSDTPMRINADGEAVRGRAFHYAILERPLSTMLPWDAG
ncbi:MAG: diacylglycerol/lipid kinase family protein [Longimicrobiales bacterium]